MKKMYLLPMAMVCVVSATSNVSGHTLRTKTGYYVSHQHMTTKCSDGSIKGGNGYCGQNDSYFENQYGFKSTDRQYIHTGLWNCHGRTFDNRQSWVGSADNWIRYDSPYSPSTPKVGDAIVWFQNGTTSHTVTIVGPWNGTSTLIRSKYGVQGQYQHALSNSIKVYGSNWYITRFGAGTTIYYSSTPVSEKETIKNKVQTLIQDSKTKPWYKDVIASKAIYEKEHQKMVKKSGGFSTNSERELDRAGNLYAEVDILIDDFLLDQHYSMLGAYNSPEFSADFIKGIEAGQKLVLLAKQYNNPQIVANELKDRAFGYKGAYSDMVRGAAIFFLNQIMSNDERIQLKSELTSDADLKKSAAGVSAASPTYTEYYSRLLDRTQQ